MTDLDNIEERLATFKSSDDAREKLTTVSLTHLLHGGYLCLRRRACWLIISL